jgi:hypothetical protein
VYVSILRGVARIFQSHTIAAWTGVTVSIIGVIVPLVFFTRDSPYPSFPGHTPTASSGGPATKNPDGTYCAFGALATGYGPVARCTQVRGTQARAGFHSPITRQYGWETTWRNIHVDKCWNDYITATDGFRGYTQGCSSVSSGYGPFVFATQYRNLNSSFEEGRWGLWNLITNTFYPDGDGSWKKSTRY